MEPMQVNQSGLSRERSPTMQLLSDALPIIGMTVSRLLMLTTDFWMVSHLGTAAQAAISPATMLVMAIGCLGLGVTQAVQTFVSQAVGRGESRLAGAYTWQSLYIALAFGLLVWPIAATTHTWYGWIEHVSGTDKEVAEMQKIYISWGLWQTMPIVMAQGLQSFYNGILRSRVALVATVVSLLVNLLLNYLLIWGHWGLPALGIAGSAIATVIGWWVRVAIMLVPLLSREYEEQYAMRSSIALDFHRLRDITRIGLPIGAVWLLDIGSWVVFMQMILPSYGESMQAASNVALQYMHLAILPSVGIGIALCSQIGMAVGAGRPQEAFHRVTVAMRLIGGYMTVVGLVMFFGSDLLMLPFTHDPDVIAAGRTVFFWVALFQIGDAMQITYLNALRGAGDTRVPAVLTFLCCWGLFIGCGLLASRNLPQFGVNVPWAFCMAYIILLGLLFLWRWRSGAWMRIAALKRSDPSQPDTHPEPVAIG